MCVGRDGDDVGELGLIGDVDDEGIPGRTLFGGEDGGHRRGVKGVAAKPVDSFRGKGDETAGVKDLRGAGDLGGAQTVCDSGGDGGFLLIILRREAYTLWMQSAEIELKFAIVDVEEFQERLGRLGFHLDTRRTFEANTLYDTPERRLRGAAQILRLRQYGDLWTLTHKRHPEVEDLGSRYKVRIETETHLDDGEAMHAVFGHLGYHAVFRYEKFRTEWSDGVGHLVVDETPIGVWGELEGLPEWIDGTLERLGVSLGQCTTDSYGKLFLAWKERTGSLVDHLTFDSIGEFSGEPAGSLQAVGGS